MPKIGLRALLPLQQMECDLAVADCFLSVITVAPGGVGGVGQTTSRHLAGPLFAISAQFRSLLVSGSTYGSLLVAGFVSRVGLASDPLCRPPCLGRFTWKPVSSAAVLTVVARRGVLLF